MDEQFLTQKLIALNEVLYRNGSLPGPEYKVCYIQIDLNQYVLVWGTQMFSPVSIDQITNDQFITKGSFGQIIDFVNNELQKRS